LVLRWTGRLATEAFVISAANVFNNEFESPWLVDFAGDSDIAARYRLVV
jgi:hypothetical protein